MFLVWLSASCKECMEKENGKGTVKKFHFTLSYTSLTPAKQGGSKKDMQPAAPLEASEWQEHKLMEEIEKHHACQEHTSKACYRWSDVAHGTTNASMDDDAGFRPDLGCQNTKPLHKCKKTFAYWP
ncbi:hypothetical protein DFH07DRAFT_778981 [Mycena maculata]|uniref:Uncharacterized protein n=1 Tax=Mycena maculata TaxID=230809 RepID=A0AAD7IC49_9AGAR|nr:hypothetical protein DFH07DRAFT_778981 [Mycena maculata]